MRLHANASTCDVRSVELVALSSAALPMAVLTAVDEGDAEGLLAAHGLGPLRLLAGIAGGSVNSNFALEVPQGRFFLRLYEEQDRAGAERETAMLERLAAAGVPTPSPLRRLDGDFVSQVRGKPAALFPWREGQMRCQAGVTADDARRLGAALAQMHLAGAGEEAPAGRFRFGDLLRRLEGIAASGDPHFVPLVPALRASLERLHGVRDGGLPGGLLHGDLFRDNVLWDAHGEVAALLDFESACQGSYAYDVMVTVLSWCFGDDFDPGLASALRAGYEGVRPLSEAERRSLCVEGSFAALRFAITRITDYAMRTGTTGPRVVKDWTRFRKRFEKLQALGDAGVRALLGC
jgi:homoserine kinase type II